MKIFQDYKASKLFTKIYNTYEDAATKELFASKVKDLADKKITAQEGEFRGFYITTRDLQDIKATI